MIQERRENWREKKSKESEIAVAEISEKINIKSERSRRIKIQNEWHNRLRHMMLLKRVMPFLLGQICG
jgi:hypothetical protein